MLKIYKYPLELVRVQYIRLPEGCQPLKVDVQKGEICLWAKVDNISPVKEREIHIYGTGHVITDDRVDYLGTVMTEGGNFVWHVFITKE